MRSHLHCLYAGDFFTVEVLGIFGAVRYSVLFVIRLETREVHLAGINHNPGGAWMKQVARNLTDPFDGFLRDARYLIHDADPLFTRDFKQILEPPGSPKGEGVACVQIPPRSPNCNPFAERFVRSVKDECLRHFVFFGERHLRYVVGEYVAYYNHERFHQGIGGKLIRPASANDNTATGAIKCRSRLGGLLNYYDRAAA